MEMMLTNVAALSSDPKAWVVAAVVAIKALVSIYLSRRCPVMRGEIDVSDEMIEEGKAYKVSPPPSFLIIMLVGIALAVVGLYMLPHPIYGPLALGALVVGMFMFMTEPTRLFVNASKMEVFASTGAPGDANALARDRLRAAHTERAVYEVIIAAAVVSLLYFL